MAIPSGSTNNWLSNNSSYPGSGTTVFDAGSYAQNLTVNLSGCTYNPSNFSFSFDNTANAQLYTQTYGGGFTDLINYRTALTWHFWFKNEAATTVGTIINWMGTRASGVFTGFGFSKNSSDCLQLDVAFGVTVSTAANILNDWHLISIAWSSASGTFDIYVDGSVVTSNYTGNLFAGGPIVSTDAIYYGHSPLSGYAEYTDGNIGQSTIYPIKQNSTQVQDFYNSTFGIYNTGKVYLNASEPASAVAPYTTWSDLSNSYDFTMYNPSFTTASGSNPAYYSFPSRNYTTPVSVYGEYNGTPAITTEATWTGYFWVRRNANHGSFTQNRLSIFANGREDLISASNGWSYGTYNNPNAANDNIVIEAAGLGVFDSGDPMPNAVWVNIAYIRDSSNNINWYLDGAYLGQTAFTGYTTPANGMWISRTAGSFFSWMGDISIIREYDYSLTGTQLLSLINYDRENYIGFPTAVHEYDAADPASYPGSGSTLSDIGTATAINLTINDATFNATNDSFTLDGTLSSYIRSANSLAGFDIGGNDFSVQYWFKYNAPTVTPPYSIFLQIGSRTGPGPFNGFTHFIIGGELNIGKPGVADYATGFYPTIDQWYQITMTVDSSDDVILYVDSASEYTQNITFVTPTNILAIGDNGIQTDQVFDGSMGPLFLFDRVLSPAEITDYYNSTVTRFFPPPPPAGGNVGGRTFGQGFAG
jgi:hypothetical protein